MLGVVAVAQVSLTLHVSQQLLTGVIGYPSQPSTPTLSGSQVCQISIERKWE